MTLTIRITILTIIVPRYSPFLSVNIVNEEPNLKNNLSPKLSLPLSISNISKIKLVEGKNDFSNMIIINFFKTLEFNNQLECLDD